MRSRAKVGTGSTSVIWIWGKERDLPTGTRIKFREWYGLDMGWGAYQTGRIWREPLPDGLIFVEKF